MKRPAHKADRATKGKSAYNLTVSGQRAHAATSHRAPRTSHTFTRKRVATQSFRRPAQSRRLHANNASVSVAVASTLSPQKLVATLGLVSVLGAGVVVSANTGRLALASDLTSATSPVKADSADLAVTQSGGAASRSAERSDTTSSQGKWNLDDSSANSFDMDKLSVATAEYEAVQKKIESGIKPPSGFNVNHSTGDSGNAYAFSQCTWWVYVRRHQLGLPVGSFFGNGAQWAASAKKLGYWVDSNPQVGDVMVFNYGQEGSSGIYGHVAIVEKIENGKVITSESGASLNGDTTSRTFENIHDFQYIHF